MVPAVLYTALGWPLLRPVSLWAWHNYCGCALWFIVPGFLFPSFCLSGTTSPSAIVPFDTAGARTLWDSPP